MVSDSHEDMHAGELEVSILLAAFPDVVREGWERDDVTRPSPPPAGPAAPDCSSTLQGRRTGRWLQVGGPRRTGVVGSAPIPVVGNQFDVGQEVSGALCH